MNRYKFNNTLTNNNNFLNSLLSRIKTKIQLLNIKRTKRGLVNGFGAIIKSITGSLVSKDQERYNQIIENNNNDQKLISNKLNTVSKIDNNITNQFHDKIKTIIKNKNILNEKLNIIQKEIVNIINEIIIMKTLNLINEFIQVGQDLSFSIIQLAERLIFCKLNTLHFGIIDYKQLLNELNKIDDKYLRSIIINNIQNNYLLKTYCSNENPNLVMLIETPSNALIEELIHFKLY